MKRSIDLEKSKLNRKLNQERRFLKGVQRSEYYWRGEKGRRGIIHASDE